MTDTSLEFEGKEAGLYAPVRALLVAQGYEVKGEVQRCDVVARRGEEAPVVVELKLKLNLDLLLQGIDRQVLTDVVYLAVPASARRAGRSGWKRWQRTLKLLRLLGLGLLVVEDGEARAVLDPAPYSPRRNARREGRLLREFETRAGDPNVGGVTRRKLVTAYRQDALRCARLLATDGPQSVREIRLRCGVARAGSILQRDQYGWFSRVRRGVYALTPDGHQALTIFRDALPDCPAPSLSESQGD